MFFSGSQEGGIQTRPYIRSRKNFLRTLRSDRPEPVEGCGLHSESESSFFVTLVHCG